MRLTLLILSLCLIAATSACSKTGSDTSDDAAKAQEIARLDSIAAATQRQNDSLMNARMAQRRQEEERQRQLEEQQRQAQETQWMQGSWSCSYYMAGRSHTSKCVISGTNAAFFIDGELLGRGTYTIEENPARISADGYYVRIDPDRKCLLEKVGNELIEYHKVDSYNSSSSSPSSSASSSTSQRSYEDTYFSSDASVWGYLSGKTFSGNGYTVKISQHGVIVNGNVGTNAPRIKTLTRTYAIMEAQLALEPTTVDIYVYPQQNRITLDGQSYFAR